MPFITTPERIGIEKGLLQAIEPALDAKFGDAGLVLMEKITPLDDPEKYLAINRTIAIAKNPDEVRKACAKVAAHPKKKMQPKK